ncbi:MAG TPA: DNA repair protein RecO [Solimonas sp.]|nr:DNA repair protein RecO [Solimonas sp.]
MRRHSLEPAYLLSARPYSDTSLLLEAFTLNEGRVGIIARGARGPRSKLRGLLQALQPLLLSWTQAGELGTLTGAEADGAPVVLAGERVFYAWYLNELVLKLLARHDAHPRLFERYAEALPLLAGAGYEAALRLFEKHLLAEIGYGLLLPPTIDLALSYSYDPEQGPLPGAGAEGLAGASLVALRDERIEAFDARALADARKLLRAALRRQLGGKELATPKLLRQMRGADGSGRH